MSSSYIHELHSQLKGQTLRQINYWDLPRENQARFPRQDSPAQLRALTTGESHFHPSCCCPEVRSLDSKVTSSTRSTFLSKKFQHPPHPRSHFHHFFSFVFFFFFSLRYYLFNLSFCLQILQNHARYWTHRAH